MMSLRNRLGRVRLDSSDVGFSATGRGGKAPIEDSDSKGGFALLIKS